MPRENNRENELIYERDQLREERDILLTALRLFADKDVAYLCDAMRRAKLTTPTGEFHAHVSNVSVATILLNVLRQDYARAALSKVSKG